MLKKNNFKIYRNLSIYGFLSGLSFSPFYFVLILPFSFYYFITKILEKNNKIIRIIKYSFFFSFFYYLSQFYWIGFSLFIDRKFIWLFPFTITLIPIILSCFFVLSTICFQKTIKYFNIKNKFLITLFFSLFYVLFEYFRSFIFPWNLFTYILGFSSILMQISYIFNIYIISFLLINFFSFSYVLFEYKNKKIQFIKKNLIYSLFYIFFLLFSIIYGIIRLKIQKNENFNINLRLIQANIKQSSKNNIEEYYNNIQKHIDLTTKNDLKDIDIIIWSESSIPFLLTNSIILPTNFNLLKDKFLITGALRLDEKNNNIYNSIFIFKNNKVYDFYDKNTLVPFGEYIPFSKYIPFLKKIINETFDFSIGNGNKTIDLEKIKISPLICYEIIFKNKIYDKKNKPNFIINLTNDAWFGFSSGPFQHLTIAKFRAVENKIPIIRVSNTGITSYINEYGEIIYKTKLNEEKVVDIKI